MVCRRTGVEKVRRLVRNRPIEDELQGVRVRCGLNVMNSKAHDHSLHDLKYTITRFVFATARFAIFTFFVNIFFLPQQVRDFYVVLNLASTTVATRHLHSKLLP